MQVSEVPNYSAMFATLNFAIWMDQLDHEMDISDGKACTDCTISRGESLAEAASEMHPQLLGGDKLEVLRGTTRDALCFGTDGKQINRA